MYHLLLMLLMEIQMLAYMIRRKLRGCQSNLLPTIDLFCELWRSIYFFLWLWSFFIEILGVIWSQTFFWCVGFQLPNLTTMLLLILFLISLSVESFGICNHILLWLNSFSFFMAHFYAWWKPQIYIWRYLYL